jgi:hypothetical protein
LGIPKSVVVEEAVKQPLPYINCGGALTGFVTGKCDGNERGTKPETAGRKATNTTQKLKRKPPKRLLPPCL